MSHGETDLTTDRPDKTGAPDLDNLNGAQLEAVIDAVRLSFDADQFAMLLSLHLEKKLDDLSEPGPWPERVFNVVTESQKQGFGRQLIEAVEVERPKAERILGLRRELARLHKGPGGGAGASRQWRPPMTIQTWLLVALIVLVAVIATVVIFERMSPLKLTLEQYNQLLDKMRTELAKENPGEDGQALEEKAKKKVGDVKLVTKFWTDSTVPYEIDPNYPDKNKILAAIAEYHDKTNIRFVERTANNAGTYPDYVRFKDGSAGCFSYVGMQGGGQDITVNAGFCDYPMILHEIAHVLGLYHEHARPDRDQYIRINWDNIDPKYVRYFNIEQTSVNLQRPYDFNSVTHYPPNTLSNNGKPTIEPVLSTVKVGPTGHLSPGDIMLINAIYPKPAGTS